MRGFPTDPINGAPMPDEVAGELITTASAYAGRVERYVITDNFMPMTVPDEDSQRPPEHIDYEAEHPFRASLNGTLTTYSQLEFIVTDPETGATEDLDDMRLGRD